VLFALGSTMTITPHLVADMPFDTLHDVIPIALIASDPLVLLVNPKSTAASTASDLVSLARADPNTVSYNSYGSGSMPGILMSLMAKRNHLQMFPVAYRSNGEAYSDLLGGRLKVMLDQVTNALPYTETNRLRPLAVTSAKRHSRLPDVQTMMEAGVLDFAALNWTGAYLPANTPPDIVQRLVAAFERALASATVRQRITALGADVGDLTGERFAAFHAAEYQRWGEAIKELGLQPQ
jgi:tripartite-type tricarboxylate transporter receptor subunit TctC